MGNEKGRSGGRWTRIAMLLVVLVVAAGVGAPNWLGRQIEQQHAAYLQQLEGLGYLQVENAEYERGWFSARADYELILDPRFALPLAQLFADLDVPQEPFRIGVSERITHGPFTGGMASLEGDVEVSGWLVGEVVAFEGGRSNQRYAARIGYDRVVHGEWEPMEMAVSAGPLLSDLGLNTRYVMDYRGGDFSFDPGSGEYRATHHMGPSRLEEPAAVHTFESSTSHHLVRFSSGVLRELRLQSRDSLTLSERRDVDQPLDTRIEDQTVDIGLHFDDQGRFESIVSRLGIEGFQGQKPDQYLQMDGMALEFTGSRQGEYSWYGELGLAFDGLEMREKGSPGVSLDAMQFQLGLEPESEASLELVTRLSSRDLRIQGMEEPLEYHVESRLGQLQRAGYDELWRLFYRAMDEFRVDDPDASLAVLERVGEAGMAMMGDRSTLAAKPVTLRIGDADLDMALEADVQLQDFALLGEQALFSPGNRLEFSADVSALLVHKVARESIRQQYNGLTSPPEGKALEAMAKDLVAEELASMLELGIVRREAGDRYTIHLQLKDGELLLNGEPGEWLLGQF
ncbi:DUF945 family protein [Halomonas sp. LBP4]|uniref:DUF945 family protein n=1 Tax=Halomonas sp. LBP4 TaxID=2044917 RepID=UPI0011B64504|nr:DUF945 family protein [Halomonas sp. LBP4]